MPLLWVIRVVFDSFLRLFGSSSSDNSVKNIVKRGGPFFPDPVDGWSPLPRNLRKTLILDLDETLVHSSVLAPSDHCSYPSLVSSSSDDYRQWTRMSDSYRYRCYRLEVRDQGVCSSFLVRQRPYIDEFLETLAPWYDIAVFTASESLYANPVIDQLDRGAVIRSRYFRQSCVREDSQFLKDISMVHPNLSRVVIVDNSPIAVSLHPDNAVCVPSFYGIDDDTLLTILPLLLSLVYLEDVRSVLSLQNRPLL